MDRRFEEYRGMVEEYLGGCFLAPELPFAELLEAMRYSLLAGGKRLRPILALELCRICGGEVKSALPAACAVEMLHTYSLIHDDLPCMDDDDLRRGKPSNHKVYGESTAVLAGDALQAEAFGAILRSDLPADVRARCAEALAAAAGTDGICGGQFMDIDAEKRSLYEEELSDIQARKTGSLIVAACKIGAIIGGADEGQLEAACLYGAYLGAAFQIRDDMLDVLADESELGKRTGSDKQRGKATFMTLLGRAECEKRITKLTEAAKRIISESFTDCGFLPELAERLALRLK